MTESQENDIDSASQDEPAPSLLAEFWDFLRYNKRWWIVPIVIVLLVFGVLILLSGTGATPFIYSLQ
jgi:hypothetical protein